MSTKTEHRITEIAQSQTPKPMAAYDDDDCLQLSCTQGMEGGGEERVKENLRGGGWEC